MLIPYTKLEVSHNGIFFWLENDAKRWHIGNAVCHYNEDTQELRIQRWVVAKNASLWGLRVETNRVVVITPEMAGEDNPEEPTHNTDMREVRRQLDKAQQAVHAAIKLLS